MMKPRLVLILIVGVSFGCGVVASLAAQHYQLAMTENAELVIPEPAHADPNAFEVLRVWVANKGLHVSLRVGVWSDPAAWGLVLADLARHVANAYEQESSLDSAQTLQRIKSGFDVEMENKTDAPSGSVR